MKLICTATAFLILTSSSLFNASQAVSTTIKPIVATKTRTKANIKGWDINVTNVRYLGPVVQGKHKLHEAAGTWIAVTVTCTNTTGKRQRSDESPMTSALAELIDTSAKKHQVNETEYKYDTELLFKPYAPNETRTEVWLFDVPDGTRASQLILNSLDSSFRSFPLW